MRKLNSLIYCYQEYSCLVKRGRFLHWHRSPLKKMYFLERYTVANKIFKMNWEFFVAVLCCDFGFCISQFLSAFWMQCIYSATKTSLLFFLIHSINLKENQGRGWRPIFFYLANSNFHGQVCLTANVSLSFLNIHMDPKCQGHSDCFRLITLFLIPWVFWGFQCSVVNNFFVRADIPDAAVMARCLDTSLLAVILQMQSRGLLATYH